MASVVENPAYDPEATAEILRQSMKGLGTDEKAIVDVLATHTNAQRQEIKETFKAAYGTDLEDELKSELGGNFEDVVMALMTAPILYDAQQLRAAMSGAGTSDSTLIEIMCSRSTEQMEAIKAVYEAEYERNLEEDLSSETSGNFRNLLVSQCAAGRDPNWDVDDELAAADAQAIYDAGEARFGTDETEFNKVLSLRNYYQLRATFDAYAGIAGHSMEEAIENETSGDLQDGYKAIVTYARSPATFFAKRLKDSMAGAGTDDSTLIRIVVSRSEVDMLDIANEFEQLYQQSLVEWIESDCGGDYKRMCRPLRNCDCRWFRKATVGC